MSDPLTLGLIGIGGSAIGGALSANPNQKVQGFGQDINQRLARGIEVTTRQELERAQNIRDQPVALPQIPNALGTQTSFRLPGSGEQTNLGIDGGAFDQLQANQPKGFLRPSEDFKPSGGGFKDNPGGVGGPGETGGFVNPRENNDGGGTDPRLVDLQTGSDPSGGFGNVHALSTISGQGGQQGAQGAIKNLTPENRTIMERRIMSLLGNLRRDGRLTAA